MPIQLVTGAIVVTDADFVFRQVSAEFADVLNMEPGEIVGRHVYEFVDEEPGVLQSRIVELGREGFQVGTVVLRGRGGVRVEFDYAVHAVGGEDGEVYWVIVGRARSGTPPPADPVVYFTRAEAARLAQMSERTITRAIKSHALPSSGKGQKERIKKKDIEAWIEGTLDEGVIGLDEYMRVVDLVVVLRAEVERLKKTSPPSEDGSE